MAFHKPLLSLLKRRAFDSHSVKPPQTITSSAEGALSSKLVYTFSPLVFIFSFYNDSISCRFQTYYNYNTNALWRKLHLHEAKKRLRPGVLAGRPAHRNLAPVLCSLYLHCHAVESSHPILLPHPSRRYEYELLPQRVG